MPVAVKLTASLVAAAAWVVLSVWWSIPWLASLEQVVPAPVAVAVVALVAYLPGGLVAFLAVSLLLDRQPPMTVADPVAPVTIVIAARNEAAGMSATLTHLARQDYRGPVTVILADNGSTDGTVDEARRAAHLLDLELLVMSEPTPGKSFALNRALTAVTTEYVVTVDADTLLHPEALRRLVGRLESSPGDVVAVAGSVLVRNSRSTVWTRLQEWDYFLGIAAVKRMQGLYGSTLVAQGAFSLYRTEAVRAAGGWPDAIGEDIVVTWQLMRVGARVYFEPTAVAFTDAPDRLRPLFRQRSRWARGMVEGLRRVPPWRQRRRMAGVVASVNLLIPLLDIGYAVVWLPGLVLALFGFPYIVGLWTLAVLPVTVAVYGSLHSWQVRHVFGPLGLTVRRNRWAFVGFLLGYQAIMSPAALVGYGQELAGTRRRWK